MARQGRSVEEGLWPLVETFLGSHEAAGVAVAVVRDDEVVGRGFGVRDVRSGEPVTPETMFHLASVSKPFVATAIVSLAMPRCSDRRTGARVHAGRRSSTRAHVPAPAEPLERSARRHGLRLARPSTRRRRSQRSRSQPVRHAAGGGAGLDVLLLECRLRPPRATPPARPCTPTSSRCADGSRPTSSRPRVRWTPPTSSGCGWTPSCSTGCGSRWCPWVGPRGRTRRRSAGAWAATAGTRRSATAARAVARTLTTSGPDAARAAYQRLAAVEPAEFDLDDEGFVHAVRGAIELHRTSLLRPLLRLWTEVRPDSSAAWTRTGWAHQIDGHVDLAGSLLRRALDLDPDNHEAAMILSSLPSA